MSSVTRPRRPGPRRTAALVLAAIAIASVGDAAPRAHPRGRPAPPPPKDQPVDSKEEARDHFERAVVLFEEEAWDASLAELRRSRALYPTRAAAKNVAICLRKLQRYDEALDAYELLLREYPTLPREDRALAEREIRALAARVGTIEITGAAPGAQIVIDARTRGVSPLPALRASVGSHLVRVYRAGFIPFEARVEVTGGRPTPVAVSLQPLAASGHVQVIEERGLKLDVVVDDAVVGQTPWEGDLAAGQHVLFLRAEGGVGTEPTSLVVADRSTTPIRLAAEELDATLRIEPAPLGSRVVIDGIRVGAGIWEGALRARSHRIDVSQPGYFPSETSVALAHGDRTTLRPALERDPDSPLWPSRPRPKFWAEADVGLGLIAGLGGSIGDCAGGCTSEHLPVWLPTLRAGYAFRSGFELGGTVGYLSFGANARSSAMGLYVPVGAQSSASSGRFDELLRVSGAVVGASAAQRFLLRDTFPLLVRLGLGVVTGSAADSRSGSFDTSPPTATTRSESPGFLHLYLNPEVRAGVRVAGHVDLTAGLGLMVMRVLTDAQWTNQQLIVSPVGTGGFKNDRVLAKTVLLVVPSVGVRYDFDAGP